MSTTDAENHDAPTEQPSEAGCEQRACSAPLVVGNTYRGRRTREASNLGVYCDRRITYLCATLVQYDTPTRTGRLLPAMSREKFEAWLEMDVTAETPQGGWAPYPQNDQGEARADNAASLCQKGN